MPRTTNNVNEEVEELWSVDSRAIRDTINILSQNIANPYSLGDTPRGVAQAFEEMTIPHQMVYENNSYTMIVNKQVGRAYICIYLKEALRNRGSDYVDDDFLCIFIIEGQNGLPSTQKIIINRNAIISELSSNAYQGLFNVFDIEGLLESLMPLSYADRVYTQMQTRRQGRENEYIAQVGQRRQQEDQELDQEEESTSSECNSCSDFYKNDDMTNTPDGLVCTECYESNYTACSECDETLHYDNLRHVFNSDNDNGDRICNSCRAGKTYTQCYACSLYLNVANGDAIYAVDHNRFFCKNHYEQYTQNNTPITLDEYAEWVIENNSYVPYRDYNVNDPKYLGETKGTIVKSLRIFSAEMEANYSDMKSCNKACYRMPAEIGIAKDGSLGNQGVEFQTPLLQGKKGEECLKQTSTALIENNFSVDKLCGLHVHLDLRDWYASTDQSQFITNLKNLFAFYIAVEDIVLSFLPLSRRGNRYCQYLKDTYSINDVRACNNLDEIEKLWYKTRSKSFIDSAKSDKYHSSRYSGINFHSVLANKHLEIRYHSGTINARKILEWVNLHAIIVDSIASMPITWSIIEGIKSEIDLKTKTDLFFKILKLTPKSEKYFRDRQTRFSDRVSDEDNIVEN